MRVICPKCELKGQVDVAPKGAKTRIACVRCATTFDTVFVDGEIQALLPQASHAVAALSNPAGEVQTVCEVSASDADFARTTELPNENQFDALRQVEASHVPADDFSTSSTDLTLETPVEATHADSQESSQELRPQHQEVSQELWSQSMEMPLDETAGVVEEDSVATVQSLKSLGTGKVNRPPTDAYGMGVRLMRVSPLWLLLAGLSFISFIVFCNWLIKPTEQAEDATQLIATANNRATNQAANRVSVTTSTAQSPANVQTAQTLNEAGAAFVKTEAKTEATPAPAPSLEPAAAKPAAEEKPVAQASSSGVAGEAKEGKVTIQVGSYNVAAEAEQRVANLKSAGFEARSVAVEIPKRGTWYRVQSGRFGSRDEAERYGKQLRDRGVVSSFITTDVQE